MRAIALTVLLTLAFGGAAAAKPSACKDAKGHAVKCAAPATKASAVAKAGTAKVGAAPTAAPSASPAAKPASGDAAAIKAGRELFANFGCGSCHSLSDAGATGHVGPALDGNANLTHAFVVDRVTNGSGPMPAFGGQLSKEEIDSLSTYIMSVKR